MALDRKIVSTTVRQISTATHGEWELSFTTEWSSGTLLNINCNGTRSEGGNVYSSYVDGNTSMSFSNTGFSWQLAQLISEEFDLIAANPPLLEEPEEEEEVVEE